MGLPGSGKTTLAKKLVAMLNAVWLNADEVRKEHNDWDFSPEGRTAYISDSAPWFRTIWAYDYDLDEGIYFWRMGGRKHRIFQLTIF